MERAAVGAGRRRQAFSLIEIIGVLAIVAILAAVVLPVLLRQLDYAAQTAETAALQTLANGLQQGCLRQRHLPGTSNWASFIATNAGCQTAAVLTNGRNNLRVFLIDPTLVVGTNTGATLPYQQPALGPTNVPANPRFLLVSSLSAALPGMSSGVPSSADFNALWSNPDDRIPTNSSWNWGAWKGKGTDLRIQRVNLASSFQRLLLNNNEATNAFYSIDNFAPVSLTATQRVDAYYLTGTRLRLFQTSGTNVAQASQVLAQDTSWVFSAGYWRNANVAVAPGSGGGTNIYDGLEHIIELFLSSPCNPQSPFMCPLPVYNDMTNYMSRYLLWAGSGYSNTTYKTAMAAAYSTMVTDMDYLIKGGPP
jgi:prepilin-type N-terminal cleavage/methylation domain-containing protein